MISAALRLLAVALLLAPVSAGASGARPPVALTATPAHLRLEGAARATVELSNTGTRRVVVDVARAGFALDLRGRPRIVPARGARSSAGWLTFRPQSFVLGPGESRPVAISSRPPSKVEPGDHDALLLFTTRRRVQDGVAVRMRMGVVVVVRAPGVVVRRLELRGIRFTRRGSVRLLELVVHNRGNVTESFARSEATLSLQQRGRRVARLRPEARQLRPRTRGLLVFRYRGSARGRAIARVEVRPAGSVLPLRRTFRLRL